MKGRTREEATIIVASSFLSAGPPIFTSLLGAIEDYRNGRLTEARTKLIDNENVEARLCFLAIHTRLSDTKQLTDAISVASSLDSCNDLHAEDEVQLRIYLSFIMARSGDLEGAAIAIRESMAKIELMPSPPLTLEAELALANALILFMQGRILASERQAWNAVNADLELGYRSRPQRLPLAPIQVTKARALTLIGLIRGTQERYHEQYRFLREAMVILRQSPTIDAYAMAIVHVNRSFIARDLGMLGDIVELELVHAWAPDLAEQRLEVMRSLSYLYALDGNDEYAMRGFAEARSWAPTDALRLLLLSDEAFIARNSSPSLNMQERMFDACSIADDVNWESVAADRYGLHSFAQELAPYDPRRALRYMERYADLRNAASPLTVIDRRSTADVKYSEGVIATANRMTDRAIDAFGSAFEIWRDIGFRWRAADAALELAKLTGDRGMIGYALRETPQFSRSWLSRKTRDTGRRVAS